MAKVGVKCGSEVACKNYAAFLLVATDRAFQGK